MKSKLHTTSLNDMTKAILLVILLLALWRLKFVVVILVVAFIFTIVLRPLVRLLHRIRIPAFFAVLLPVLILASVITGLIVYLRPVFIEQFPNLVRALDNALVQLFPNLEVRLDGDTLRRLTSENLTSYSNLAFSVGTALAHTVFSILTILVLTMYWLTDYDKTRATVISFLPTDLQKRAKDILLRIEEKLGRWFIGQMIVSSVVGVTVWITAHLLGLPYAGVLGILAALLEIIPTIGPVLAALPAVGLAASDSFEKAIIVTVAYIVIQQLESNVLSPMLLGRTIKLHPIVIIVSFLSGGILFGVVGALFAVPVALIGSAFVDSYRSSKNLV
jgi:predicted PurR-regulated permease PerM